MNETVSISSYLAAAIYAAGAVFIARVALFASKRRLPRGDKVNWWAMSGFFVLICIMRLTAFEHRFSDYFRLMARMDGVYGERRDLQRPLVAVILVVVALALALFMRRRVSRGRMHPAQRAIFFSRIAAGVLLVLIVMRMISLHAVDHLLYGWGPFRLNYFLDLGSCAVVIASAWTYRRVLEKAPRKSA